LSQSALRESTGKRHEKAYRKAFHGWHPLEAGCDATQA